MINVKDFGAIGDGSANDQPYVLKAISAAIEKEYETVFFPEGRYFLQSPISIKGARYLTIKGDEAVVLCKGVESLPNSLGAGGGIEILGDHNTIKDLQFEGHLINSYSSEYGNGKLLRVKGNYNSVQNCFFKGGNGGAVEISHGQHNTVEANIFDTCNYYPPKPYTGDYGAIHVIGRCKHTTISNNKITNHRYSGISAYGTGRNGEFSNLYIYNNYIESASANRNVNHSMGIYLLNGANQNIEIIGNTIDKADAECIVIFSQRNSPAANCKIHNNILLNGAYQGLALRSQNVGGTFRNCSIKGNFVGNYADTADYHHQMFFERLEESLIQDNTLRGYLPTKGYGIYFYQDPSKIIVNNNKVSYQHTGIAFYSKAGSLKNNIVSHCEKGIRLAYCEGSTISHNFVTQCKEPVEYKVDKTQLRLSGNKF
ncbi:right-handed parallel beta-helix repeat-containing protein [Catalinimonas niigatensis]|uniref:right-handed parallel beta-helix repeat-containing protein n=1 Tax=Catalinimonas niigatensis TaxID=1397264 RepID=UPI0026668D67|nr:right-handed parallel beta-helix repeat-containing protein [Catalinimonas niigatensis]WPP53330.1 right-handed parallel beta-helix repeat-containing protein [Catalinimonas niigatensis]